MPARLRSLIAACLLFGGLLSPSHSAAACSLAGGPISLSKFDLDSDRNFYSGVEGDGQTTRPLGVFHLEEGACSEPSKAIMRLQTATAGEGDLVPFEQVFSFTGLFDDEQTRDAVIKGDEVPEPIEHGIVDLTKGDAAANIVLPSRAPLYIIDDDGSSRTSFAEAGWSKFEYDTRTVAVPIFRSGPTSATETVTLSLSPSSTAESSDYTGLATGAVTFGPGERAKSVKFNVVNDQIQSEGDETIVLHLEGSSVVSPDTFTFTIIENDTGEIIPPRTRFHHPKHKVTYDEDFWKVFEYHVYAKDNDGGTGLDTVQMALKKKLRSGGCKWWAKPDWVAGPCRELTWVGMRSNPRLYPPKANGELLHFVRNPDGLVPSMGTKVESYTVFSRAGDLGGNTEEGFEFGRNRNVFEVRPAG